MFHLVVACDAPPMLCVLMAIYLPPDAYGMPVVPTNVAADTVVETMLRLCPQIKLVPELWRYSG